MLPDIAPDMELGLMQEGDPPGRFLARAAAVLAEALGHVDPALAIVQGDTATAYAGALAAFRLGIPIAHVEAGLRTASIAEPFPEELLRRRSEERRVGKECVSPCRSRWSPYQ